jgi:putative acetyltransferase
VSTITVRRFLPSDTKELIELFRDAVHTINIKHYSPEQVAVWAPEDIDHNKWCTSLEKNITFVAQMDGKIVGFADMTHEGYLDRLYIHKDYQGRFIALRLLKQIEQAAREIGLSKITTHCSITAKIPAERMGFKVIKEQKVVRKGVELINYVMEKNL